MKILFVRFSSLGDVILTTGVMRHIKEMLPDAEIDVLTYKQFEPVFDGLDFISNVFAYDKNSGIKEYFRLIQTETEDHDYIFDLHGKLRSKFLKFHTKADYHCYRKDSAARRAFVKKGKEDPRLKIHVVQKYFETALKPLGLEMPELEKLRPVMAERADTVKGRVLVHPFASKKTKEYPFKKELGEMLIEKGFTPVFAGEGDMPDVKGAVDETGSRPLSELFDVISSCEAVISSDSGPMHAGIALGKPTVAIFGSTTKHFGFYPEFGSVEVLENNMLDCRPCGVHGLDHCPKEHFKCMLTLQPELAVQALSRLLGSE